MLGTQENIILSDDKHTCEAFVQVNIRKISSSFLHQNPLWVGTEVALQKLFHELMHGSERERGGSAASSLIGQLGRVSSARRDMHGWCGWWWYWSWGATARCMRWLNWTMMTTMLVLLLFAYSKERRIRWGVVLFCKQVLISWALAAWDAWRITEYRFVLNFIWGIFFRERFIVYERWSVAAKVSGPYDTIKRLTMSGPGRLRASAGLRDGLG